MYHPLEPRRRPTVPLTCPVVDLYASRLRRVRPNALVAIGVGRIPYLRMPIRSISDMFVHIIIYEQIVN